VLSLLILSAARVSPLVGSYQDVKSEITQTLATLEEWKEVIIDTDYV
jgi:hypothetical protein